MIGLSQIVLQVGLCNTIARVAPETQIAMRVRAYNPIGDVVHDQTFRVYRGESNTKLVTIALDRGLYNVAIEAPKYRCATNDELFVLPDHNRLVAETLADSTTPRPPAKLLISGAAPPSFLYAKPSFVLVDINTPCKGPIGDPIPANIVVENDQDAYYAWFYTDPALEAHGPMLIAVKLATATGEYHYIRLKLKDPFPIAPAETITFDVTEDMLDEIAGNPPDTLLCLKLWESSAH